ncbi:MAG TPA: hypothetical protein PKI15_10790 [Candidatus Cloacimonadota bacterium]|nr:hypothetical protein [Candidatus Cloacimonadota bacterium]
MNMAQFRAYWEGTEISDLVVGLENIPVVSRTHDGEFILPTTSIEVIWGANSYTKDEVVYFTLDGIRFASFIIEEVTSHMEEGTQTLQLVDQMKLLEKLYMKDLTSIDYSNAITGAEDVSGAINVRYYFSSVSSVPHRVNFVTVTYLLKACLVKAGLATAANIDMTALYGNIESGFYYWDSSRTPQARAITLEQLCFHPHQIKWAGYELSTSAFYEGANLLQMAMICLWILNAEIRYVGTKIKVSPRLTGDAPDDDDVYSVERRSWLNSFDMVTVNAAFIQTCGTIGGFAPYFDGTLSAGISQAYSAPDVLPTDHKLSAKVYSLLKHVVVHRRDWNSDHYETREFETMAYGETFESDYHFANQLAKIVQARFPGSGTVETITVPVDVDAVAIRPLLGHKIDAEDQTSELEY